MSLDCYPLAERRTIGLPEQPMAMDVAYESNLLITVIDNCQTVVVHDLSSTEPVSKFPIGDNIVIDQVAYCQTGDYIACAGHKDGRVSIYVALEWRSADRRPQVEELNFERRVAPFDEQRERGGKLNGIATCQRTGNLAASYGDLVVVYRLLEAGRPQSDRSETPTEDQDHFEHIMSVRLSIQAQRVALVENFLSIMTADHVQVLKLELLTLQIQSDGLDGAGGDSAPGGGQATRSSSGSSGESQQKRHAKSRRQMSADTANSPGPDASSGDATVAASSTTATTMSMAGDNVSMISNGSNISTATDFSAFSAAAGVSAAPTALHPINGKTTASGRGAMDESASNSETELQCTNNDSDLSIITMNNQQIGHPLDDDQLRGAREHTNDDCVTWNLNTKKLVKLPTLMHNTSSDLSSYHICHPLELLGPASESIACRVLARLYSRDFCQNQLEPVVLLCRQFDSDREPVKSAHLQALYLSHSDDHKRLGCRHSPGETAAAPAAGDAPRASQPTSSSASLLLLKSADYELLASVSYFVTTLTNCFVYSLHGKKVTRLQTITHPDLCLDLRPDLLNVHLLTPLGLQICSTGSSDATFRYDWSSSADLNLSFVACNRARVLTTADFLLMVSSSPLNREHDQDSERPHSDCFVEFMAKPNLDELFARIVHTINRCQSISIRSNLLTYLHASAQLTLIEEQRALLSSADSQDRRDKIDATIKLLKSIAVLLCKQLLQKKQTNVITNGRIDKAIKHLLDISYCDLAELMTAHLEAQRHRQDFGGKNESLADQSYNSSENYTGDDDDSPLDCDYELLRIYLKNTKYNPSILEYLQTNSDDRTICSRLTSYMFDTNPRLLIKCAQRFTANSSPPLESERGPICLELLMEKLRQLLEFDSTGINRATVLFTLAILHNAAGDQRQSLRWMAQINPLSHLAITMCSNHETIGRSMAELVNEHHPEVFRLFLAQLNKRDSRAASEFELLLERPDEHSKERANSRPTASSSPVDAQDNSAHDEENADEADEDFFEQKLRLVAELSPVELADLMLSLGSGESSDRLAEDKETIRAFMRASINLHESQFILSRLCENSR